MPSNENTKSKKLAMNKEYRKFLKHTPFDVLEEKSDQQLGVPPPPLQQPYPKEAQLIDFIPQEELSIGKNPLMEIINQRTSVRKYSDKPLSLEELSFLLWVTQGVKEISSEKVYTKRTVPSGGARHPFETYLIVNRVEGLDPGLYRYLSLEHKLCFLAEAGPEQSEKINQATYNQKFINEGAVIFVWSVVPYRCEWRYDIWAHKAIALDAGHLCQNLYLGCGAINAGTCAIAAYDQEKMDEFLGLDGEEEFTIYLAPVGKI